MDAVKIKIETFLNYSSSSSSSDVAKSNSRKDWGLMGLGLAIVVWRISRRNDFGKSRKKCVGDFDPTFDDSFRRID